MLPRGKLATTVDTWTVQSVVASGWLTRFYRAMGDSRQASLALQVGEPGMERFTRLRLQPRLQEQAEEFKRAHSDDTEAEAAAWSNLIEAYGGLAAFIAVTDMIDGQVTPGMQGVRTATKAAFRKAIRGLRTAFPEEIAEAAVAVAVQKACRKCVDTFLSDVDEAEPGRDLGPLRVQLNECVGAAVYAMAEPKG